MSIALEPLAIESFDSVESARNQLRRHRLLVIPQWLQAASSTWIWSGITLIALGFGLIALTWSSVSQEDEVYRQLPQIVSGGFTSLGLILVGMLVISVATRHVDALLRQRQNAQVITLLEQLASSASTARPRR